MSVTSWAALVPVAVVVAVAVQWQTLVGGQRGTDPEVAPPVAPPVRDAHRTRRPRRPSVGRALATVLLRGVPAAVGALALLVALDWATGSLWDRATSVRASDSVPLAARHLPEARDPRVRAPALVDSPWAERYFAELEALPYTYLPFIGPHEQAVHGRFINSNGMERRSYEPPRGRRRLPVVWFFGGSTLWGEGQRDLHTIPSEVSRMAEAAGTPIRVVNFGERGYSALQELLVFERELARGPAPDLAVFYHGFNELSTQTESPDNLSEQPMIFQVATTEGAFARAPALPGQGPLPAPSVGEDYAQTSAVHKLWRELRALVAATPASAAETGYLPPPDLMAVAIDNADAIYRRTMDLVQHVAQHGHVPIAVYWQPSAPWPEDAYGELTARVATVGGGIDVSHAFDQARSPVYLDGIHTNELGARLVATAMWPTLARRLEQVEG